jgi:hypothetical protein
MASRGGAREAGEGRKLSIPEINLLLFLNSIGVTSYNRATDQVELLLDAEDVCSLVELAFELLGEWQPQSPLDAFNRTARLLGVPVLVETPTTPAGARPGGGGS